MSEYSLEETGGPQPSNEGSFGRYRLAFQLASGGMGAVFLARADGPAGFEKLVALKRIHPHMATDQRFVSMFLDEARIASRIQHPNVCGVIDFGETDGSYFLTMPYIIGESMNKVIGTVAKMDGGPVFDLAPLIAARLVADACEGLHAAHELRDDEGHLLDVVHRDVSPQNLIVGYDGVVRVLDFGVASARHRHYQTTTGEVKGKFAYLAPEQIDASAVDRRADVWALGVVLWEAVTQRRLFARATMPATIKAVGEMPIPLLGDVRPGAPAGLEPIVQRALSRDVEQRYPTARAMGRDIQAVLAREERFVGAADVADWLEQLFPDGRRSQERLVEQTRTGRMSDPTMENVMPATTSGEHSAVLRRDANAELTTRLDESSMPAPPPQKSGSALLIAAAIAGLFLAVGSVAAVGVWWIAREPAQMRATSLPAAAEPRAEIDPIEPPPEPIPRQAQDDRVVQPEPPPLVVVAPPEPVLRQAQDERVLAPEPEPPPPEPVPPEPAGDARGQRLGPGTLTVATPGGWGIVYLGARQLGEAPGVFRVPGGIHTIQIAPFGRSPRIRRRVVVPEGGTATVSVPIHP